MRLLVIGYPLPNPAIDNYNVMTAPSYFDYDALLVDPASITRMVRQVVDGGDPVTAFDDRPVINGQTTASAVSAADQIRRRLAETERLLEQGGVVLVMAKPNATESGLIGFEGCDRYSWLPAPEGISWSAPILQAAEGVNLNITDDHHPVGSLVREYRRHLGYRAVFDARHPAFQRAGRIWAEARPGLPVGVDFSVRGGRVCFFPAVVSEGGMKKPDLAAAVVSAARSLLGGRARERPPAWVRDHTLPGLEEAAADIATHEAAMKEAAERLEDARARAAEKTAYRDLLWADGPAYEEAVRRSLELLGFEVTSSQDEPLAIRDGEATALVEIESTAGKVTEWPYIRLQRRLDELLRKEERLHKGLLIVNGRRLTDPAHRGETLTGPLLIACENYRYGLVTADTLFEVVVLALEGDDPERLAAIRRRMMRRSGLLSSDALRGETTSAESEGTLF